MYLALYRKYRPKVFDDVISQPHITTTLKNEIIENKTAHSYLFTGSRGTGKTSCAHILAMAINCLSPKDGNPCLECENCKLILEEKTLDVIEIDAASNNGVDNIRQLKDEANYTPSNLKYRVYIIDETHMLSVGAFNALLKIMEEPPEHVKFILATTEAHKVPATILSRCQRFDFYRITANDIKERLLYVASKEDFTLSEDAAFMIAKLANGGMRDALSILDRCVAFDKNIDLKNVINTSGASGNEYVYTLTDAVLNGDSSLAVKTIDKLYSMSKDMQQLLADILYHFRNIMLKKVQKDTDLALDISKDELTKLEDYAKKFTLSALLNCILIMQESLVSLSKGFDTRLSLEMCFIKLCNPELSLLEGMESIDQRLSKLEDIILNQKVSVSKAEKPADKPSLIIREDQDKVVPSIKEEVAPQESSIDKVDMPKQNVTVIKWADVLQAISQSNMPLFSVLSDSKAYVENGALFIEAQNALAPTLIKQDGNAKILSDIIQNVTGIRFKLRLKAKKAENEDVQKNKLDDFLNKAKENGITIKED